MFQKSPFEPVEPPSGPRSAQRCPRQGAKSRGRLLLVPFLTLCLALAAHADEGARSLVIGWIDAFEGEATDYSLRRGDEVLPVYPLMRLRAGDRIELGEDAGPMRVHISETEEVVIDQSRSPYLVPAGAELTGLLANLLEWAAALFDGQDEGHGVTPVEIKSRGDETLAPASGLLFIERVKLVAGQRPLALAWINGTAPFSVRLAREGADTEPVLEAADLPETTWVSPPLVLESGSYLLEIQDARQRRLVTEIEVLEPGSAPRLDPGLLPAGTEEHLGSLLEAAWLAGQEGGWIWRLEAYQAVAGAATRGPSLALSNALVRQKEFPIHR